MVDRLKLGQALAPGQELLGTKGNCKFSFQADGNCVLYRITSDGNWEAYWASNTHNQGASTLVLQEDGNLVSYREDGSVVWSPQTENKSVSIYVIQDDENFVAYTDDGTPVWASNTYNPLPYEPGTQTRFSASGSVLSLVLYNRFEIDCNGFRFWGDAGGLSFPGMSALVGTVYTANFTYLTNATQGFSFAAAVPYLQINFIEPNSSATIGVFRAANIGSISGGGGGSGGWRTHP